MLRRRPEDEKVVLGAAAAAVVLLMFLPVHSVQRPAGGGSRRSQDQPVDGEGRQGPGPLEGPGEGPAAGSGRRPDVRQAGDAVARADGLL